MLNNDIRIKISQTLTVTSVSQSPLTYRLYIHAHATELRLMHVYSESVCTIRSQ